MLEEKEYFGIQYTAINPEKEKAAIAEQGEAATAALESANKAGQFNALGKMALFPAFMLVCYVVLFLYFKGKGGYKAVELGGGSQEVSGAEA